MLFRGFSRLLEAIKALTSSVDRIAQLHYEMGPALDRLEKLERSRIHFEAECEGMLLKADGKLRAANSAEARERQLKKAHQRIADPLGETLEEGETPAPVLPDHVAGSETEGLRPVRLALAPNNKTAAVRAKFGLD